MSKTLHNTTASKAKDNVSDLKIWGDGDTFKLICKASSDAEGWMKSTKAMPIPGIGVVVQVTTQQRNPDGSYSLAEAVTFVPGVALYEQTDTCPDDDAVGTVVARRLVAISGY